jgi:hypothetical protein
VNKSLKDEGVGGVLDSRGLVGGRTRIRELDGEGLG